MPPEQCMLLSRAIREVAALVMIWVGTAAITFIGVPALVPVGLLNPDGTGMLGADGAGLLAPPDEATLQARQTYFRWAGAGFVIISMGMFFQGVTPAQIIRKTLRLSRYPE